MMATRRKVDHVLAGNKSWLWIKIQQRFISYPMVILKTTDEYKKIV
jgi:hypothetical protein